MTTSQWDFLTGDPEKDRRNVQILLASVEELYGPRSLTELMQSAVDRAIWVTGAERGLLLAENEVGKLAPLVARDASGKDLPLDMQFSNTVVRKVWTSGEASLTMDTEDQHSGSLSESIFAMRLLSVMAVPMPVKGRNLGVLYVHSTARVKEFSQSDFAVFRALGGLTALAVENARLLAEKEEQERLKRELLVAQQIQQRLLPSNIPQPPGYQLAGTNWPCDETSGDYYDVIAIGDGRIALVVGDVSGHGLGPALIMASTRALLHSSLVANPDPVHVIRAVNAYLERDIPDNSFMSFFLGILDPETRAFQYVSAGHNPPLLRNADGSLEQLIRTGPVLGVIADAIYTVSAPRTLEPGSALMLYTDGIYEAHDPKGRMYGEDRLCASFERHAAAGAAAGALMERVLEDLTTFVGDQPLDDDVTCLVLRVL